MEFLTNERNIAPLRDTLEKAEKRIWISSAWIRAETLYKVFTPQALARIREKEIDIRFLIRVGRIEDLKITNARQFFAFLEEKLGGWHSTVQVRYTRHLHAKLNVIDTHLVKWLFEDIIKAKLDEGGLTQSSKEGKKLKTELTGRYLSILKSKKDLYQDLRQKAMETEVGKILKSYRSSGQPVFSPEKYEKLRLLFEEREIGFVERSIIDKVKKPGVYVIELRDLEDDEERKKMVGRLLQQVFDESKRSGGGFPTLIVVEEAHNYAPERKGGGGISFRELRRIASEGRKFHVGLLVITQRPALVRHSLNRPLCYHLDVF